MAVDLIDRTLYKDGNPVVGAIGVLRNTVTGERFRTSRTDINGRIIFDNVDAGFYDLRFFGSGTNQSDWILGIEVFETLDPTEDVDEYVSVSGLRASNLPENYAYGFPDGAIVSDNFVSLEWEDMRLLRLPQDGSNLITSDAFGREVILNQNILNGVYEYTVFIFISDNFEEPNPKYPMIGSQDYNGEWFIAGNTNSTSFQVQCPVDSRVAFWVGFKSVGTLSDVSARVVGESDAFNTSDE